MYVSTFQLTKTKIKNIFDSLSIFIIEMEKFNSQIIHVLCQTFCILVKIMSLGYQTLMFEVPLSCSQAT